MKEGFLSYDEIDYSKKKYEKKFARDNNNHKIFSHACL